MMPRKKSGSLFDDFFNTSISGVFGSDFAVNHPSVNIIETDKGYRLEVAASGVEKSDFETVFLPKIAENEVKKVQVIDIK